MEKMEENGKLNAAEQGVVVSQQTRKRRGCSEWCKKFFWEGQNLEESHQDELDKAKLDSLPMPERLFIKYRRVLGLVLPGLIFHFFWWAFMIKRDLFYIYVDKYFMAVTMIFGSLIAGMTSEGGGAVAFPVMTFVFKISPVIARDFSLMIQAVGMTCAAAAILFMKIQVEWVALCTATVGGAFGIIIGFHLVDPHLTPAQKKMGFVSIWFSFAFALFLLNRYRKRQTFNAIPEIKLWKIGVLFLTGVIGSIFTSFAGNGLDICTFSILTLLFRVSEKVATPTSVVLMALNSMVGFYWRALIMQDVSQEAFDFFYICGGVVTIGAPLGSVIGSHFHRLVLAGLIYVLDTVTLITAFIVVPQTPALIGASLGILVGGFIFFYIITLVGNKMLTDIMQRRAENGGDNDVDINDDESVCLGKE